MSAAAETHRTDREGCRSCPPMYAERSVSVGFYLPWFDTQSGGQSIFSMFYMQDQLLANTVARCLLPKLQTSWHG